MIYFVTSNKGKFAEASNIRGSPAKEHRLHRDSGRHAGRGGSFWNERGAGETAGARDA